MWTRTICIEAYRSGNFHKSGQFCTSVASNALMFTSAELQTSSSIHISLMAQQPPLFEIDHLRHLVSHVALIYFASSDCSVRCKKYEDTSNKWCPSTSVQMLILRVLDFCIMFPIHEMFLYLGCIKIGNSGLFFHLCKRVSCRNIEMLVIWFVRLVCVAQISLTTL